MDSRLPGDSQIHASQYPVSHPCFTVPPDLIVFEDTSARGLLLIRSNAHGSPPMFVGGANWPRIRDAITKHKGTTLPLDHVCEPSLKALAKSGFLDTSDKSPIPQGERSSSPIPLIIYINEETSWPQSLAAARTLLRLWPSGTPSKIHLVFRRMTGLPSSNQVQATLADLEKLSITNGTAGARATITFGCGVADLPTVAELDALLLPDSGKVKVMLDMAELTGGCLTQMGSHLRT